MRKTESKITGQINMCVSLKGNIYWWYWGKTFGLMKLDCFHYRLTHAHLVQGQILHVLNQFDPFSLNTTFIRHSMYEYICNYTGLVCSVFNTSLNHIENNVFLSLSYAFCYIHSLFRIIFYPKYELEQA